MKYSTDIADFPRFRFMQHFADKLEHNCHFLTPGSSCCNIGKLISLFLWSGNWLMLGKPCSAWQSQLVAARSWEVRAVFCFIGECIVIG
jgi:hypothetical protein